ncbi:hypothetical protein E2C01_088494 [Portunus trituberculatus]|uniref:Uncharacterized protein n=1 Tax=Portunus trituberculatus TaxID=210409 RepID=A0A5B7JEU1_PORTR|nr:hypothetical protein [Portunus trituberculatus]
MLAPVASPGTSRLNVGNKKDVGARTTARRSRTPCLKSAWGRGMRIERMPQSRKLVFLSQGPMGSSACPLNPLGKCCVAVPVSWYELCCKSLVEVPWPGSAWKGCSVTISIVTLPPRPHSLHSRDRNSLTTGAAQESTR